MQLQGSLEKGYIRPTISPWGVLALFVKKKDVPFRSCIDYGSWINSLWKKVSFSSDWLFVWPNDIENVFWKIDLMYGYHKFIIKEEFLYGWFDVWFTKRNGHYEFVVVPFGLTNAQVAFMCLMNSVFIKYLDKCVLVFLYDTLIDYKIEEENEKHSRMVSHETR